MRTRKTDEHRLRLWLCGDPNLPKTVPTAQMALVHENPLFLNTAVGVGWNDDFRFAEIGMFTAGVYPLVPGITTPTVPSEGNLSVSRAYSEHCHTSFIR
jgi:hypothetical protein